MSGEDSSEKTEQATPKKLREARKKGQVPRSNDVAPAFTLIFVALYFWLTWDWLWGNLQQMVTVLPQLFTMEFGQALTTSFDVILKNALFGIMVPFALVASLAGIIGNVIQFGFMFSLDPIIPKPEKVSPADGFKRIFSTKQVIKTLLSLLKTVIVGVLLLIILRTAIKELVHAVAQCDVLCQQDVFTTLLKRLLFLIIPSFLVLAVIDYLMERTQFMKQQKMTKEELKREFKEMLGDPHIRGAISGIRREMAEQDLHLRLRTARLIILDLSIAIALHYEQDVTPLPVIVVIGRGETARKMVEIAHIENIPLVSDPALAQRLLEEGKLDQYIPESTINLVGQAMRKAPRKP